MLLWFRPTIASLQTLLKTRQALCFCDTSFVDAVHVARPLPSIHNAFLENIEISFVSRASLAPLHNFPTVRP